MPRCPIQPCRHGSDAGMDARGSTPEEMRDRMAADIKKWATVIEEAGIEKQ